MTPDSKSTRILYAVARGDAFGGSSLHVMDMAKRLTEEGYIVRVLVGGTPEMEVPRRYKDAGIDFVCLPMLGRSINPFRDLKAAAAIRKEMKRFKPDLVSLHASKAGAVGRVAALGIKCPLLYTPHCWSFVDGFSKGSLYRLIEKILAPTATQIITVSEDERQLGLSEGVGKAKTTHTIHNGVKDQYSDHSKRIAAGGPTSLVMVGRFEEQKDQYLLITALSQLRDLEWKMTFIGDGPLQEECIELVNRLELSQRFHFSGYSDAVDDILTKHHIFTLITNWEGFPRSILEAMAASLPVVVTDVGGSRESVADGETGYLVKHSDADDLATKLRLLITRSEQQQKMGEAGRDRYLDQFTFETMYSNYEALYREIIESSPSAFRRRISPPSHRSPKKAAELSPASARKAVSTKAAGGFPTTH